MHCVSQDSLPDSTLLALRLCEIMSSTFVITQGLNEILSFDQSSQYARLLGDSSGSSSWNPTLIVLINAAWIVVAILLTVCFCRKCDGAEQFATWASTSSDIQYARNRMAQRLAEAEAKKSAPDKQRELLKKSWNRNQVTMIIQEGDFLVDDATDAIDLESNTSLSLRIANGGERRTVPNGCAICLSSYNVGENVVWSNNCPHCFHEECVTDWLVKMQESTPCPCCRQEFTDLDEQRNMDKIKWAPGAAMDISVIHL